MLLSFASTDSACNYADDELDVIRPTEMGRLLIFLPEKVYKVGYSTIY